VELRSSLEDVGGGGAYNIGRLTARSTLMARMLLMRGRRARLIFSTFPSLPSPMTSRLGQTKSVCKQLGPLTRYNTKPFLTGLPNRSRRLATRCGTQCWSCEQQNKGSCWMGRKRETADQCNGDGKLRWNRADYCIGWLPKRWHTCPIPQNKQDVLLLLHWAYTGLQCADINPMCYCY
jgi:hypothetical protein